MWQLLSLVVACSAIDLPSSEFALAAESYFCHCPFCVYPYGEACARWCPPLNDSAGVCDPVLYSDRPKYCVFSSPSLATSGPQRLHIDTILWGSVQAYARWMVANGTHREQLLRNGSQDFALGDYRDALQVSFWLPPGRNVGAGHFFNASMVKGISS